MKRVNNIFNFLALNRFAARKINDNSLPSGKVLNISDTALMSLFKTLNEQRIKFLICGSVASAFHRHIQPDGKIEIWLSSKGDLQKLRKVLILEADQKTFSNHIWTVKTAEGSSFVLSINFNLHYFKQDSFDFCYTKCVNEILMGVPVSILHLDHLIIDKIASAKIEEKAAIRELERIQRLGL